MARYNRIGLCAQNFDTIHVQQWVWEGMCDYLQRERGILTLDYYNSYISWKLGFDIGSNNLHDLLLIGWDISRSHPMAKIVCEVGSVRYRPANLVHKYRWPFKMSCVLLNVGLITDTKNVSCVLKNLDYVFKIVNHTRFNNQHS